MILQDLAVTDLVTMPPDAPIDEAIRCLAEHDIHHLPVVDDGAPIGIVSDRDILLNAGGLEEGDRRAGTAGTTTVGQLTLRQVMTSPVRCVSPEAPIETAARMMIEHKISAVPLVRDGRLVGIVTETDFLKCYVSDIAIAPGAGWRFRKVVDRMSPRVVSMRPNDTVDSALRLMRRQRLRHLTVVEDHQLVGIVSDRDLLTALFDDTLDFLGREAGTGIGMRSRLADVMAREVETADVQETLAAVAERMMDLRISAVPVVAGQRLLGILTDTDLVANLGTA